MNKPTDIKKCFWPIEKKKVLHRDVRSIQALVHSFVNQPKKEKEKIYIYYYSKQSNIELSPRIESLKQSNELCDIYSC